MNVKELTKEYNIKDWGTITSSVDLLFSDHAYDPYVDGCNLAANMGLYMGDRGSIFEIVVSMGAYGAVVVDVIQFGTAGDKNRFIGDFLTNL